MRVREHAWDSARADTARQTPRQLSCKSGAGTLVRMVERIRFHIEPIFAVASERLSLSVSATDAPGGCTESSGARRAPAKNREGVLAQSTEDQRVRCPNDLAHAAAQPTLGSSSVQARRQTALGDVGGALLSLWNDCMVSLSRHCRECVRSALRRRARSWRMPPRRQLAEFAFCCPRSRICLRGGIGSLQASNDRTRACTSQCGWSFSVASSRGQSPLCGFERILRFISIC